ncbi:MAG: hypothetical protein COC01_07585 [Bacteroidetes bacterium]|nr:MAG: hypothetical protein COC01_07585 [Bacteroidota bacterium]
MYIKVINPKTDGTKAYDNKGSSRVVVNYLSKEDQELGADKEMFFNRDKDMISAGEVVEDIDGNTAKLGKGDAKFYTLAISPDDNELSHLGKTPTGGTGQARAGQSRGLKEYTKTVMDEYAKNFNRDLSGKDIKWYAKLEYNRYYKGKDREVRAGGAKQGDLKPGNNMHVHVIISRKDMSNSKKLSPLANEKGGNNSILNGRKVQRGFNRDQFKERTEKAFDGQFNYSRNIQESYRYFNTMKNGSARDKVEMMELSADQQMRVPVKSKELTQKEGPGEDQPKKIKRSLGIHF